MISISRAHHNILADAWSIPSLVARSPVKPVIARLRFAVLDADDAITERFNWRAPSFCFDSVDRVTFNLRPLHHVQLILHRGAKTIEDDFRFDTSKLSGLLEMIGQDRGQVIFSSVTTGPTLAECATRPEAILLKPRFSARHVPAAGTAQTSPWPEWPPLRGFRVLRRGGWRPGQVPAGWGSASGLAPGG